MLHDPVFAAYTENNTMKRRNNMYQPASYTLLISLLRHRPSAFAKIRGGDTIPEIRGDILFYETRYGVFVVADVMGLPYKKEACANHFFAFHIHEGSRCEDGENSPFATAGGHYNPDGCTHPVHAGDLPPLLSVQGRAFSAFLTDRFSVSQIIGKTVIIHENADDFTTQSAGNAGKRIACGVIRGS